MNMNQHLCHQNSNCNSNGFNSTCCNHGNIVNNNNGHNSVVPIRYNNFGSLNNTRNNYGVRPLYDNNGLLGNLNNLNNNNMNNKFYTFVHNDSRKRFPDTLNTQSFPSSKRHKLGFTQNNSHSINNNF